MSTYPRITEIPDSDVYLSRNAEDYAVQGIDVLIERSIDGDDGFDAPLTVGDIVYVADSAQPSPSTYVNAAKIIERIDEECGADSFCESDPWPDVTDSAIAELQSLLDIWIARHAGPIPWLNMVNIREYAITQADIDAATGDSSNG